MTAPSRATIAGQAYLELRRKARQDRRPVDELIQLYVLEGFLARLTQTPFAERFVLKGGMLLAALGERRPTRDIDLQADITGGDTGTMLAAVRQIARTPLPDGVVFDLETAAAREIRDEDIYPGVRVTMTALLRAPSTSMSALATRSSRQPSRSASRGCWAGRSPHEGTRSPWSTPRRS